LRKRFAVSLAIVQCGMKTRPDSALKGFPGFYASTAGSGSHSTANENGINKKPLQLLISIVNLARPFRAFLQQV
jgi:hypothetical protein